MGALEFGSAREALRPYGLFVFPGCAFEIFCGFLWAKRTDFPYGFTLAFAVQPLCTRPPIVRSLAHLPETQQYHHAFFDAALTEPAWPGFFPVCLELFFLVAGGNRAGIHCPLPSNFDFYRNMAGAEESRAPARRVPRVEAERRSDEAQE
jgi:hypothetical protein